MIPFRTDRRGFLAISAAGVVAWLLPGSAGDPTLRVGVLVSADSGSDPRLAGALAGLALGTEEATRTAELFRRRLQLERTAAGTSDAAAAARALFDGGASAVIALLHGDAAHAASAVAVERQRVLLHVVEPLTGTRGGAGDGGGVLHVAPSGHARAEAVLRVLHQPGERPAGLDRIPFVATAPAAERVAHAADATVASAVGAPPLLGGTEWRDAPVLAFAAHDASSAAQLLTRFREAAHAGTIVDLLGATEGLAPGQLPPRLIRADAWTPALERFGAAQLNDRFRARFGPEAEMRGPAWAAWFAAKLVVEAMLRLRPDEDAAALPAAIRRARYDGHQGTPLAFDERGELRQPLHVVVSDDQRRS